MNHKCQFGTCVDGLTSYSCICKDGFSGTYCDLMTPIALALKNSNSNDENSSKSIVQYQQRNLEDPGEKYVQCEVNDCQNGGLCYKSIDSKQKCKCKLGYSGSKCEILKMVQYQYEDSYLEFESPDLEQTLNITFSLITESEDGILFYHGSKANKHLAVELFKGRVRISYDIGNTLASSLFSNAKINDSKCFFI